MRLRLFVVLTVWAWAPVAIAHDGHPRAEGRVHTGGICWDPDVEFPVPCDDDDD
jgi:hypothetical protein